MADTLLFSLAGFGFIILLGFISESLFDKTHIPDVLILFMFGIIIGPVLGYVSPAAFAGFEPVFVSLALILIIFEGSVNIKFSDLLKGATSGGLLAIFYFITCVIVISAVMVMFGYPLELALLLGTILGGTTSAVIIPMAKLLNMAGESSIILTLESTLTDVLSIVGTLTIIEVIKINEVVFTSVVYTLLSSFLVAIFLGVIAGLFWLFLKDRFPTIDKAYMITIAYAIILYVFAEGLKANGAIAVLALGIIMGNSKKIFNLLGKESEYHVTEAEKNFYAEISFFIKVFFFVYLGVIISFSNPFLFLIGLILTAAIAFIRPRIVNIVMHNNKEIPDKDRILMGVMTPQGLAPAVLVQIAIKSPYVAPLKGAPDISTVTLAVILFSIVLTSALVFYYEKFVLKTAVALPDKKIAELRKVHDTK